MRRLRDGPDAPDGGAGTRPHPCLPSTPVALLEELDDLCNAVQCPTRGLFLRNYMMHVLKDVLPDRPVGEGADDGGGDVGDAVAIILVNFERMVTLWGRMHAQAQHNSRSGDANKKQRDRERNELRLLVGSNLVRLSQLENLTEEMYEEKVLPEILERAVTGCKDTTGQSYVMDCVIQVFPDEFHVNTLQTLLSTLPKLKAKVNTRNILQALMKRLANYASNLPPGTAVFPDGADAFELFVDCIGGLKKRKSSPDLGVEFLRLQVALLAFASKVYSGDLSKVNQCLGNAATYLGNENTPQPDMDCIIEIEDLLRVPLSSVGIKVLDLPSFEELMACLPLSNRREVAVALVRSVVNTPDLRLDNIVTVDRLLTVISPLLQDNQHGADGANEHENFDVFEEEQGLVGRIVHLLDSDDTDLLAKMYNVARRHFGQGGVGTRLKYTLVPIVYGAIRLTFRVCELEHPHASPQTGQKNDSSEETTELKNEADVITDENLITKDTPDNDQAENVTKQENEENNLDSSVIEPPPFTKVTNCRKLFIFLQQTIGAMSSTYPELSLKLYLQCAMVADQCYTRSLSSGVHAGMSVPCDFPAIAYEFIDQAFNLYEEEITDSKAHHRCIEAVVGTLSNCRCFEEGDYEVLITRTTQYSAKVLKKVDQSRLVLLCSRLFYQMENHEGEGVYTNPKRVLECLQRSLKIANGCMTSSANLVLFVDILDNYLFYFKNNNPIITDKFLSGLIALIKDHRENMVDTNGNEEEVESYFTQIIAHIKRMKMSKEHEERFASVIV